MGKLYNRLQEQLKTEFAQDAKDCLEVYDKLKEINGGHVWESNWNPLVETIFKGFPSDDRRYKLTPMGQIFIDGIRSKK